jgi:hypothetical protein
VLAALVPAVPQAVPEVVVSGRAAAGPQPEAVTAASERQAAGVAVEQPDEPQAEAVAAEVLLGAAVRQPAAARLGGEAVRRPAAARRADGAVQRRAAVLPDARVLQAAQPLAVPSAAASVFHQGPSLATGPAGPARPRAAKRFAHAMRSLPIASRSEPWSQAARNEGWSCGELPRKVL